jgi:hypothetical protein
MRRVGVASMRPLTTGILGSGSRLTKIIGSTNEMFAETVVNTNPLATGLWGSAQEYFELEDDFVISKAKLAQSVHLAGKKFCPSPACRVQGHAERVSLPFPRHHIFLDAKIWMHSRPIVMIEKSIHNCLARFPLNNLGKSAFDQLLESPEDGRAVTAKISSNALNGWKEAVGLERELAAPGVEH